VPTTTYDIKLRYSLDDRASKGADKIAQSTERAARSSSNLGGSLTRLGGLVVGAFGVRAAAGALIGFNSSVEDTKLQIGGMLALAKKSDLTDELKRADKLYASLAKRAMTLPGTTQEYVTMAGNITQPIIDAGLSMRDLEDLTVNATVAAKALRYDAGLAARDIDQALRGQFHATDPFAGKVLGAIGYKGEEGRHKFNSLDANERASELKRALTLKQWNQLAEAQGKTFSGVMSTIQDRLQQVVGKVGLPLFTAIGDELQSWNKYIENNQTKVNEIARSVGEGLVSGFRMVKDAVVFLVQHRDELMMVAKVLLAAKGASMLGNVIGGGAGAFGMLGKTVGGKGGIGMGQAAGPLGAAFAVGWQIGTELRPVGRALVAGVQKMAGVFDHEGAELERRFQAIQQSMKVMDDAVNRARDRLANKAGAQSAGSFAQVTGAADMASGVLNLLKDVRSGRLSVVGAAKSEYFAEARGLINESKIHNKADAAAELDRAIAAQQLVYNKREGVRLAAPGVVDSVMNANMSLLTDYQRQTVDIGTAQEKLMQLVVRALVSGGTVNSQQVLDILRAASDDPKGEHKNDPMKKPGKVSVTIQRIEVKSEDPDRFAFNLVETLRDARRSPSSTARGIRG